MEHYVLGALVIVCIALWIRSESARASAAHAHRRLNEWTSALKIDHAKLAEEVHSLDKDVEYVECWLESQGWEFHLEEQLPARWVKAKKS